MIAMDDPLLPVLYGTPFPALCRYNRPDLQRLKLHLHQVLLLLTFLLGSRMFTISLNFRWLGYHFQFNVAHSLDQFPLWLSSNV